MKPINHQIDPSVNRIRSHEDDIEIWCHIRQRWMKYTPEEVVRQAMLVYLKDAKGYWPSHIAVEKNIKIGDKKKRFDILVYDKEMKPEILVECKSTEVNISDKAVKQLLQYNLSIKARYLILTNGVETYALDTQSQDWLSDIPEFG